MKAAPYIKWTWGKFLYLFWEKWYFWIIHMSNMYLVNPKGNQPWIFIERIDAKDEAPILWPPNAKSQVIGKDPDAGKDWRKEEKGATEDEMVGWHHWLDGHEFEQALGIGDGQGSLVCYSPWGHKESDTTERLNWTELINWLDAGGGMDTF